MQEKKPRPTAKIVGMKFYFILQSKNKTTPIATKISNKSRATAQIVGLQQEPKLSSKQGSILLTKQKVQHPLLAKTKQKQANS